MADANPWVRASDQIRSELGDLRAELGAARALSNSLADRAANVANPQGAVKRADLALAASGKVRGPGLGQRMLAVGRRAVARLTPTRRPAPAQTAGRQTGPISGPPRPQHAPTNMAPDVQIGRVGSELGDLRAELGAARALSNSNADRAANVANPQGAVKRADLALAASGKVRGPGLGQRMLAVGRRAVARLTPTRRPAPAQTAGRQTGPISGPPRPQHAPTNMAPDVQIGRVGSELGDLRAELGAARALSNSNADRAANVANPQGAVKRADLALAASGKVRGPGLGQRMLAVGRRAVARLTPTRRPAPAQTAGRQTGPISGPPRPQHAPTNMAPDVQIGRVGSELGDLRAELGAARALSNSNADRAANVANPQGAVKRADLALAASGKVRGPGLGQRMLAVGRRAVARLTPTRRPAPAQTAGRQTGPISGPPRPQHAPTNMAPDVQIGRVGSELGDLRAELGAARALSNSNADRAANVANPQGAVKRADLALAASGYTPVAAVRVEPTGVARSSKSTAPSQAPGRSMSGPAAELASGPGH
ncbi:hypothetical protein [Embleya sp. NBC_00896]|uniref:hypothetical protein n=1 Tax=Embleya sp. NBC_00896 TaxID=2975961 RepID=UPI002F91A441|nr:hypothetical protein OG928_41080 [Embleya sp. NBC_00896]